jgi:hypothetical protein
VDALMAGPLGAWLTEQAAVREEAKKKASGRLFWGLLAAIVPIVVLWVFVPFDIEGKFWISAVSAMGVVWWSQGPKRAAVKRVKSGINDAIADALGLTYQCDIEPDDTFAKVAKFGLLPSHDRVRCEDRWSGTVDGKPFTLFEAHLEERRGSGKSRHWVTVFRGPIMAFGFNRRFHGTTIVQRAGAYRKFFGGKREEIEVAGLALGYVDMVHPGFEDAFDVYSNDQVEARYLVHPVYIERLIALETAFSGHDIRTLFDGGQLLVALENENMFESGSIEAKDDRAKLAEAVEQFARMAELADALNEPQR